MNEKVKMNVKEKDKRLKKGEKKGKKEKEEKEEETIEEEEAEEEEIDYEYNYKKSSIKNKVLNPITNCFNSLLFLFNKTCVMLIGVLFAFIILLIYIIKKRKKIEGENDLDSLIITDNKEEGKENKEEKIKNELMNAYNNDGVINIKKYYEENINQGNSNNSEETEYKNTIHINIGFNQKDIDNIIKHLASVLDHSNKDTFVHFHIMDVDTFSYESFIKLLKMSLKINNNTEITLYNSSPVLKDFKIKDGATADFLKEYAKLYAFKAIKDVQKIIFLDADDCMVQKDLSELYNLDLNGFYARGISEDPSLKSPAEWLEKYLHDKSHYINGGVILVNLELCQKDDLYNKAIQLNNDEFYTKTEQPAQDILNVLMRKKIDFFHPKYNKINFYENQEDKNDESKWYPWVAQTLKESENNNHFYSKEELIEADNDPVIIHYAWDKQLNKVVKNYEEEKDKYAKLIGLS